MPLPIAAAVGGSLISGGLNYLGQRETNEANLQIAREANAHSARQAQRQMDFQERMSNSEYQRAVKDMKSAGINPLVAYMQGGASTPTGAAGEAHTAHMENSLGKGLSSAMDALRLQRELEATDSQIGLNKANAATAVTQATANLNSAKKAAAETSAINTTLEAVGEEAKFRKEKAKSDRDFLPVDQYLNRIYQGVGAGAKLIPKANINLFKTLPKGGKK